MWCSGMIDNLKYVWLGGGDRMTIDEIGSLNAMIVKASMGFWGSNESVISRIVSVISCYPLNKDITNIIWIVWNSKAIVFTCHDMTLHASLSVSRLTCCSQHVCLVRRFAIWKDDCAYRQAIGGPNILWNFAVDRAMLLKSEFPHLFTYSRIIVSKMIVLADGSPFACPGLRPTIFNGICCLFLCLTLSCFCLLPITHRLDACKRPHALVCSKESPYHIPNLVCDQGLLIRPSRGIDRVSRTWRGYEQKRASFKVRP
jgi:hypothetical protein